MSVKSTIDKFWEIANTQGTNAKKDVLRKYENDEEFKYTLKWYFNNLIVTGLKERKIQNLLDKDAVQCSMPELMELNDWGIIDLLNYLETHNTGRDDDAAIVLAFADIHGKDEQTCEGIYHIATKSWTAGLGIGVTVINSVYGENFIPEFKVQLCQKYWDNPEYFDDKDFGISPKLDGYCFIAIKHNGKTRLFSRSGKEFTGQFPEIEKESSLLKVDDIVFHGERMPLGFMQMDSKKQFKLAASSMKKGEKTGFCLAVYDCIDLKEWNSQNGKEEYRNRYLHYMDILKNCKYLFPVPNLYIGNDQSEIMKWFKWSQDNDKEGIIIKNLSAPYQWERSPDYCKIKAILDADVKITGIQEGRGQMIGMCGAFECVDEDGNTLRVGSGLKKDERIKIWANQEDYIGKTIEITYMEKSTDKNGKVGYRHPIYKCEKLGD